MSALAQALGAFTVGFSLDRVGRKWPAVAADLITVVGTAVQYTAHSRGSFLAVHRTKAKPKAFKSCSNRTWREPGTLLEITSNVAASTVPG